MRKATLAAFAAGTMLACGAAQAQQQNCFPSKFGPKDEIGNANHITPEKTLQAFADHGEVIGDQVSGKGEEAQGVFDRLVEAGIDLDEVFLSLENEGVDKFKGSWTELLDTVKGQMEKAGA